ncbi:18473_t:CDS:2 [Racocetra persica]|uniref:18473_t:CDS:1 n=1 Tax=Racocetra persica TaxID=160502 RepID=A0ACA9SCA7_9GLOM|nr:18473_t:CDS:2 [Racocetra persica]
MSPSAVFVQSNVAVGSSSEKSSQKTKCRHLGENFSCFLFGNL